MDSSSPRTAKRLNLPRRSRRSGAPTRVPPRVPKLESLEQRLLLSGDPATGDPITGGPDSIAEIHGFKWNDRTPTASATRAKADSPA